MDYAGNNLQAPSTPPFESGVRGDFHRSRVTKLQPALSCWKSPIPAYNSPARDGKEYLPTPSFPPARMAREGEQWMRNPGGKGFSRVHPVSFRKGRRDRRAAEKPRLKPARSKEESAPWSPKESPSPPSPGLRPKLGVGKEKNILDRIFCRAIILKVSYDIVI
jgi:hypothetical protein